MSSKFGTLAMSAVVVLSLMATACSGGDDSPSAEDVANDPVNAPITQIDEGSGGVAAGPIVGLLVVQPSFGFGVWDVDRATGEARAVPGIASVETVDRNRDLVIGGGAAYALGGKVREGQSFASDVSVVKIDYATGQVSQVVALGFDRETDDSEALTSYRIEAVAGANVIVSAGEFGSSELTYTVYDGNTGAETASYPRPSYEFTSDSSSCFDDLYNLTGLSDSSVMGTSFGLPAFLDIATGEVELAVGCDDEDPELAQFVTPANFAEYTVFSEGAAPTPEQVERLLQTDLNSAQGFVEGDGDLWWIEADVRVVDDVNVIMGGVVQFDIASRSIEAVHPLGENLGEYITCNDDGGCEVTTIEQAQMRYIDGRLVIVDGRENGKVLTLDPTSGAVTTTVLEAGEGIDYTSADLLTGEPNAIWLEVSRFTTTENADGSRSSGGPRYIEHFDLATNQIDLSLTAQDLFF